MRKLVKGDDENDPNKDTLRLLTANVTKGTQKIVKNILTEPIIKHKNNQSII